MYKLEFTHQYLKDLKLARKRKFDESKLNIVIQILLTGNDLPEKYKDPSLARICDHEWSKDFQGII